MTYVKTYLLTLKTHVVNLKCDAKDLSRDLQRLEVRGNSDLKLSTNRKVKHDVYGKRQTVGSCMSQKHETFFNLSHSFEKLLEISR